MKKILLFGVVIVFGLSLSGCHMQRQPDRSSPTIENDNLVDGDNNGNDESYTETDTVAEHTESNTISEFQETYQDLIDEIEYEIERAGERLANQLEEFVAGTWEAIQDSDETVEIIGNTFIRRINDEVIEEGYLYTFVDLGGTIDDYVDVFDGMVFHYGLIGELRSAIESEQESLLRLILEDATETSLENPRGVGFAIIIVDYEGQTFDFYQMDHITDVRLVEIRFDWISWDEIEPIGISFDSRSFRRPR